MVVGIGTDIIEVARVKKSIETIKGFKEKIFSEGEIEYCESKKNKYEHYAARFAAKEAYFKAIGTGWRHGLAFKEIEIAHDSLGKPLIILSGNAKDHADRSGYTNRQVSLSHIKETATAVVILEIT